MTTEIWLIIVFCIGYLLIVLEHPLKIDKTASALIMGAIVWSIYILSGQGQEHIHKVGHEFNHHFVDIAGILFFLIGAMTIVEIIDIHDGFHVIVSKIRTNNKVKLLWIISIITFFLSSVLDNLTTAIVMGSLLTKIINDRQERLLFAGMVIIAANAGGAWSPIGDVTTTMLWIKGQISTIPIMKSLFLPSVVCALVPLSILSFKLKGELERVHHTTHYKTSSSERIIVLLTGIFVLLFVPVFKLITHLPPFIGMFFGVGLLWLITDIMHVKKSRDEKKPLSVFVALSRVDIASALFFFGILSTIAALQSYGTLQKFADYLNDTIGNIDIIVLSIGILSAIVDNVPLVAATQGMYSMEIYEMDNHLWHFIAYCAGTGGSMLIIGSAAGVAIMGIVKIDFIWYLKNVGYLAALGYFSGAAVYLLSYYNL